MYPSRWLRKVAVLAMGALSMCVGMRAQSWSAAVNVSNNTDFSATPQVATDAAGNINVVWEDDTDTNSNILFSRSTDGGMTFSVPVNVSPGSAFAFSPQIAVDSKGVINVVWADAPTNGEQIFVSQSKNSGASFSSPMALSDASVDAGNPVVAVDGFGNVNVAWEADSGTMGIFFSHSTDGGVSYSTRPQNLASNTNGSFVPRMAVGSDGSVNVVWEDDTALGHQSVSFNHGDKNGSFAGAQTLSKGPGGAFAGQLSVDAAGNINVAWLDMSTGNGDVYFSRSTQGGSFSTPVNLSATNGSTDNPHVANDSHGNVYVTWQDTTGGSARDIFAASSSDGGVSFSAPQNLSGGLGDATFPSIAVDTNDTVTVAWQLSAAGQNNIFVARTSGGASFSTAQNLLNDSGRSTQVELAADNSGSMDAVWIDNRAGLAQVFASQFASPKPTDRPPVANAGADQNVEATGPNGALVTLDGSASSDPDAGDTLTYAWTDENNKAVGSTATIQMMVPVGMHTFTLTVTDQGQLSSSATTHVTVRDSTAPTIQLSLSPTNLWPANHKLVQITATIGTKDTVDASPNVRLVSITSNDPSTTRDDIQAVGGGAVAFGTDVRTFLLRADRDPKNAPRVYTVTYCAKDASGNSTTASAQVSVGPQGTTVLAVTRLSSRNDRQRKPGRR